MFTDLYHKDRKKTPSALSCFKHFRIFLNLYSEKIKDKVKNKGNCFRFAQRVNLLCRRFLRWRNDKYLQRETSLRIVLREIHGVTKLVRGLEMGDEEMGRRGDGNADETDSTYRNADDGGFYTEIHRDFLKWMVLREIHGDVTLGLRNIDGYF